MRMSCPLFKDSDWLTLEVCREHLRNSCRRDRDVCRYAHPPKNIDTQDGRIMCCFDFIKGKCQRLDPPCKYFHPPKHLQEMLLQNGRSNLIWRKIRAQATLSSRKPVPFVVSDAGIHPVKMTTGIGGWYSAPTVTAAFNPAMPCCLPASVSGMECLGFRSLPLSSGDVIPVEEREEVTESTPGDLFPSAYTSGNETYWSGSCLTEVEPSNAIFHPPIFIQGAAGPSAWVVVPQVLQHQVTTDTISCCQFQNQEASAYQQMAFQWIPLTKCQTGYLTHCSGFQ